MWNKHAQVSYHLWSTTHDILCRNGNLHWSMVISQLIPVHSIRGSGPTAEPRRVTESGRRPEPSPCRSTKVGWGRWHLIHAVTASTRGRWQRWWNYNKNERNTTQFEHIFAFCGNWKQMVMENYEMLSFRNRRLVFRQCNIWELIHRKTGGAGEWHRQKLTIDPLYFQILLMQKHEFSMVSFANVRTQQFLFSTRTQLTITHSSAVTSFRHWWWRWICKTGRGH